MSDYIIHATSANFEAEVAQSQVPVLIDFWAPWCMPCIALNPAIEKIAAMYEGKVKVVKINTDDEKELAERFEIRGIPQLFVTRDGKSMTRLQGRTRTRLCDELDQLLE